MTGPVLIVEDDPDIAEILRYVLENENLKTRVARSGEEGLTACLDKHNPPSLILLDLLLPGMSGSNHYLDIVAYLRHQEYLPVKGRMSLLTLDDDDDD